MTILFQKKKKKLGDMLYIPLLIISKVLYGFLITSAVAFESHTGGRIFDPRSRQTWFEKTGSDNSTAKRPATIVSVTGPRIWPL